MQDFLEQIRESLDISRASVSRVSETGQGALPSIFAVSDLATASIAAAAAAAAEFIELTIGAEASVEVDRPLASRWFGFSIKPMAWKLPDPWDPIAGDYRAKDGWIRLHTNAPHHRDTALRVLGCRAEKDVVSEAVAAWDAEGLESAIVAEKGCAAAMRSISAWAEHPQGRNVNNEPLIANRTTDDTGAGALSPTLDRPLAGVHVLDLTRVLAGPVATRFLAGLGADVLRLDPPGWDEPAIVPEVTLGKRCAEVDLTSPDGRERFLTLLSQADVLVHGYRPDALDNLGLDAASRRVARPGLVDIALDAYGWTGPWRVRRGFDSLVQMSSGIAEAGMRLLSRDRPTPLPVQALDHATGYLLAAAAIRGLTERTRTGRGYDARASLARTARLLTEGPQSDPSGELPTLTEGDWSSNIEATAFGPARRLRSPVTIAGRPLFWSLPASRLASSSLSW